MFRFWSACYWEDAINWNDAEKAAEMNLRATFSQEGWWVYELLEEVDEAGRTTFNIHLD